MVYNAKTPDLYTNNAHHKIGWVITWVAVVQVLFAMIGLNGNQAHRQEIPKDNQYQAQDLRDEDCYRYSRDSGQGTEPNLPRNSGPSVHSPQAVDNSSRSCSIHSFDGGAFEEESEKHGLLRNNAVDRFLVRRLTSTSSQRIIRIVDISHSIIERSILLLGFVTLVTGVVTYGGFFVSTQRTYPIKRSVLMGYRKAT